MKKLLFLIVLILMHGAVWAQNDVSLVVSGEGKNKDEATFNALRSAIEQVYGTFVSANTTVLNDQLVADEIVSLSSGNIQKYEYLNEKKMPSGSTFVTLFATVSIDKLVSFAESKGMEAELKGSLFAMNIKKMEFDKMSEEKAVENLCKQLETMLPTLFDYEINVDEPKQDVEKYFVGFTIKAKTNKSNMEQFIRTLFTTLGKISLNQEEIKNYKKINRAYYPIEFYNIMCSLIGVAHGSNTSHYCGISMSYPVFSKRKELPPPANCSNCDDKDNYYLYPYRDKCADYDYIGVSDIIKKDFIDKLETLGVPYSECYSRVNYGSSYYVIKTFINVCHLRSLKSFRLLEQLEESATKEMYAVKISDDIRQYFTTQYCENFQRQCKSSDDSFEWATFNFGWPPYDQYIIDRSHYYGDVLIEGRIFYTLDEISKVNNITVSKPTTEEEQSHKTNNQYNY